MNRWLNKCVKWTEADGTQMEGIVCKVSGNNVRVRVTKPPDRRGKSCWRSREDIAGNKGSGDGESPPEPDLVGTVVKWVDAMTRAHCGGRVVNENKEGKTLKILITRSTRKQMIGKEIWRDRSDVFSPLTSEKGLIRGPSLRVLKSSDIHSQQKALKDLNSIPWSTSVNIANSSSGTAGVLFVEFATPPTNSVIVLKCDPSANKEIFATELARRTGLVTVPYRMISYADRGNPDYQAMVNVLRKVDHSTETGMVIHKRFLRNTGIVIAMQLIPHPTKLFQCPKESFNPSDVDGRRRLESLGHLVALDAFINNADRVPVVCTNSGNAGNIILSHNGVGVRSEVIAIDQVIQALDIESGDRIVLKNFENHRDRVVLLFCEAALLAGDVVDEDEDGSSRSNSTDERLRRKMRRLPMTQTQRDQMRSDEVRDGWGWAGALNRDRLVRDIKRNVDFNQENGTYPKAVVTESLVREACLLWYCDAAEMFFASEWALSYLKKRAGERRRGRSRQSLDRVRDFIAVHTRMDIGDEGLRIVARGVSDFLRRLLSLNAPEGDDTTGADALRGLKTQLTRNYGYMDFNVISDAYLKEMHASCADVARCESDAGLIEKASAIRDKIICRHMLLLASRFAGKWSLDKDRSSSPGEVQTFMAAHGIGWIQRKMASNAHFDKSIRVDGDSWVETTTATILSKTQTMHLSGERTEEFDDKIKCNVQTSTRVTRLPGKEEGAYLSGVAVTSTMVYVGKGLRQRVERTLLDKGRTYRMKLSLFREESEEPIANATRIFTRKK